jgi:hypothetical protein
MLTFEHLERDKTGCEHMLDPERTIPVQGKLAFQCRICGSMVVNLIDRNGKLTGTRIAKFA